MPRVEAQAADAYGRPGPGKAAEFKCDIGSQGFERGSLELPQRAVIDIRGRDREQAARDRAGWLAPKGMFGESVRRCGSEPGAFCLLNIPEEDTGQM